MDIVTEYAQYPTYGKIIAVTSEEIEYFVLSLHEFAVDEIGSKDWLCCHEMIIKLNHQAMLEEEAQEEEEVKKFLLLHQKLRVLVHEAHCVFVWKTRVLGELLPFDPNPEAAFYLYTILYYEGAAISLLETTLCHQNEFETLDEISVDLVDYCAQAIAQLIELAIVRHNENFENVDVDDPTITELERQTRDLIYTIGFKCLSILNFILENLDILPSCISRTMITVHDIPDLLSDVLHYKPWLRKTSRGFQKFIDEKWTLVRGSDVTKVVKYESHSWFCFRHILFDPKISPAYEITEFRQKQLTRCVVLLNKNILDQLPPMAELKHYLYTLQVTQHFNAIPPVFIEDIPKMQEFVIRRAELRGGFSKIAFDQAEQLFALQREEIEEYARRLDQTDLLAKMDAYVLHDLDSRNNDCKEEDWLNHKNDCLSLTY